MREPHKLKLPRALSGFSLGAIIAFCLTAVAQGPQNVTEASNRGVELYKQGNIDEAIETLRAGVKLQKDDFGAWHYLGLALAQQGKRADARTAHERAAKVAEKLLNSALERPTAVPQKHLLDAADSAHQYIALSDHLSNKKIQEWRDREEFLRLLADDDASGLEIYSAKEVSTKARITFKQEPSYTEDARQNSVIGTVILRAVLAADGHVRAVRIIKGLPRGLTRRAIIATQGIKFVPALKDGRPVSMWVELQYSFNLY